MDGQPALSLILAPLSVIMARVEAVVIADLPYVLVAASLTVLVGTMLLWARAQRAAVAPEGLAPLRALRAEIAGRKGEDAVARELERRGLPSLCNVILSDGDGWAELDHVVRTRAGIVVLETKNWSGWVTGELQSAKWWQHRPDRSAPRRAIIPFCRTGAMFALSLIFSLACRCRCEVMWSARGQRDSVRRFPVLWCRLQSSGQRWCRRRTPVKIHSAWTKPGEGLRMRQRSAPRIARRTSRMPGAGGSPRCAGSRV